MAFSRWDPFRDFLLRPQFGVTGHDPPGWTPPVDLHETPEQYVITAEVSGLRREDIDVQVHDGQLTLRGRRPEPEVACEQYHRVERGHGTFSRTFELPQAVEFGHISADLRDGVLTVTVPKSADQTPRRVPIA